MLKFKLLLLFTIAFSINLQAQLGKIHYIIEYNKNGDTLACYEYNKKGLIKNIKLYNNYNYMFDKLLKTHLAYEYIYNNSNEFSLLTKEIDYGFIEKHSFCTCSDPYCDIDGCNQIEIQLNIPYLESTTEYFYSNDLKFKYEINSNFDTGRYIFLNCYTDSCLQLFKKNNRNVNFQENYFNSKDVYSKLKPGSHLSPENYNKVLRKDSIIISKDELYQLSVLKICDCPKKADLYDTLELGDFNFYKDSNNMYYAFSEKYGKIFLKEKMLCYNDPKKYDRLIFNKYNSTKTDNGYGITITPFIMNQIPQKDLIKKIRENKKSRLKIKRYLY